MFGHGPPKDRGTFILDFFLPWTLIWLVLTDITNINYECVYSSNLCTLIAKGSIGWNKKERRNLLWNIDKSVIKKEAD